LRSCSSSVLQRLVTILEPLGVGVGPFATFHIPIIEPYFLSVTWFDIRSIVRLIRFSL
jgi:hypothetical protein